MVEQQSKSQRSFMAQRDQPLIGVMVELNGTQEVCYFTDEAGASVGATSSGCRSDQASRRLE